MRRSATILAALAALLSGAFGLTTGAPGPASGEPAARAAGHTGGDGSSARTCRRPRGVQRLVFNLRKYPKIRRHFRRAVRRGWPLVLVLNRRGADARRNRLFRHFPVRRGRDRDEYPPAVGRGRGRGLMRGRNPRGWRASVAYVPISENRSHGATLGNLLRPFCNGTRFRYVFRRLRGA
jgi:hypothetical protein